MNSYNRGTPGARGRSNVNASRLQTVADNNEQREDFSTKEGLKITSLEDEIQRYQTKVQQLFQDKHNAEERAKTLEGQFKKAQDEIIYYRGRFDSSMTDANLARSAVEDVPRKVMCIASQQQRREEMEKDAKIEELEEKLKYTEERIMVVNKHAQTSRADLELEKALSAKYRAELVKIKTLIENTLSEAHRMRVEHEGNPQLAVAVQSPCPSSASAIDQNGRAPRQDSPMSAFDSDEELEEQPECMMMMMNNISADKLAELGINLDDD